MWVYTQLFVIFSQAHTHMDRCAHAWHKYTNADTYTSICLDRCLHGDSLHGVTISLHISLSDRQTNAYIHAWHVNCHIHLKHQNKTKNKINKTVQLLHPKVNGSKTAKHKPYSMDKHGRWKHTSHTHLRSVEAHKSHTLMVRHTCNNSHRNNRHNLILFHSGNGGWKHRCLKLKCQTN